MATEDIFNLTDTWNAGGTTFSAIKMNVTDTASASGSLLIDLQVGGSSKFSVTKGGVVAFTGVTNPSNSYFTQYGSSGHQFGGYAAIGGAGSFGGDSAINLSANFSLSWSSTTYNPALAPDLQLYRDAANTLAQRNSTNAQAFRVYNTYTDASNYERAAIDWTTNTNSLTISTSRLGTGSNRNIIISAANVTRIQSGGGAGWQVDASGNWITIADNTYDIGASGATRPRNLYVGTNIISPQFSTNSFGFSTTSGGYINFTSRAGFESPADGVLKLRNNADTDFGRLQLGGTTNSFGAIGRDGAGISIVGGAGGSTAHIKVPGVTVANLPAAATAGAGARSFVTDALTPTFGSAVVGGGAVNVPVYSTGSAWNVG